MSFKLNSVVPWGRNLDEYRTMFMLDDADMKNKIAGFGDGPASFNCEATRMGCSVTSFDPIYRFTREQLRDRINEIRTVVMKQMAENVENYVWTKIKSPEELEHVRMSAMGQFLEDYDNGRREGRYIPYELPGKMPFDENTFDIGLSSHFLLMYTSLGYDFHIAAMTEMLRVCREIRIFPIVDLDGKESPMANDVISYFEKSYIVEVKKTQYEFQKSENMMLTIKNQA